MALEWNLTKIKDSDNICWQKDKETGEELMSQLTNALIWATMIVSLGEITKRNIDEWLFRLEYLREVNQDPFTAHVSREDLEKHIGLYTNASQRTRAQFKRDCAAVSERRVQSRLKD
jgi:hypothetical protein